MNETDQEKLKILESIPENFNKIKSEISKVIVGQDKVIDALFTALLSDGHILLEGVPGLGKTLMIRSFAKATGLKFSRVQFTPDLMPQDITGSEILEENEGKRSFRFVKGPLFANIILADEINRTPPKTQSALLEAMQEKQITSYGNSYELEDPFLVMATQNPLEHEGTYPLPEAQLDRFLFYITLNYPSEQEEVSIALKNPANKLSEIENVLSHEDIPRYREITNEIAVSESVSAYAVKIVRKSRPENTDIENVKKYIDYGAGPRGSQFLINAAKAFAALKGKESVSKEEIDFVIPYILRHRIVFNFRGQAEGYSFTNFLEWIKDAS